MHQIYKDKKYRSGSNKRANTIKFKDVTKEFNTIKSHDKPIPKKKKEKKSE